jgi:dipeptidyl aminopeptidase/acylaminoacyl peptidase
VARVSRVPIAFTRIDRWLIGVLVVVGGAAAGILWLSQAMVAPVRPRVSDSKRPTIGLALRADAQTLRVARAAGPAKDAGLRAGDRIAAIEEKRSPTPLDVANLVAASAEGASLHIEARRGPQGPGETGVLAEVKVAVRDITPADEGLRYEDVSFRNPDGLILRGWYLPPPGDGTERAPGIAYGHGNATDRRDWLPVAVAVHDAGFAQLLFDFTGRGDSDGDVITLGAHEGGDLRTALDDLAARADVDPLRLAVGGRSMGAAAALFLAAEDARIKALVLDSPYTDLKVLVDRTLSAHFIPAVLVRPILFDVAGWRAHYAPESVRPIEAIRKVKVPILLFHGTKDTIVPFDDALKFRAAAGGPLTLAPLEGLDHNAPRPSIYQDRIVTFLTKSLPSSWRAP